MERKTTNAFETKVVDADQGVVEAVFAVMGNLDEVGDVLHPGSFSKTFLERGHKVKVLDQHRMDSTLAVVGKPLELRELSRAELPSSIMAQYPEATGAAWARVQFLMTVPEGKGLFERIKNNLLGDWSFGYDTVQADYSPVQTKDGSVVNARNLREVKLYELSPVIYPANPATTTLSAKAADAAPDEAKPWRAVRGDDGKWRVYKLDGDGDPTGDALGTHDSEDEAQAQVRALYASEKANDAPEEAKVKKTEADGEHPAAHYLVVEDAEKPSTWHLRVLGPDGKPDHRLMGAAWAALHGGYRGNVYEGPGKAEAIRKLTALYGAEELETPKAGDTPEEQKARNLADWIESRIHQDFTNLADYIFQEGKINRQERIGLSGLIGDALDAFHNGLQSELFADLRTRRPEEEVKALSIKIGRVIAKRNAERLSRALAELNDVLKDAGLLEVPEDEDSDADAKSATVATQTDGGPNAAPPIPACAGTGPDTETPQYLDAIANLKRMQLELLQLEVQ